MPNYQYIYLYTRETPDFPEVLSVQNLSLSFLFSNEISPLRLLILHVVCFIPSLLLSLRTYLSGASLWSSCRSSLQKHKNTFLFSRLLRHIPSVVNVYIEYLPLIQHLYTISLLPTSKKKHSTTPCSSHRWTLSTHLLYPFMLAHLCM